ncbi:MAG: hypothetical protein ACOCRK_05125 [bacterium]
MKLSQITEDVNVKDNMILGEAPVGLANRLMTNIGAALGLDTSEVRREVNREMLDVSRDLKSYMGGSNIKMGELSPSDMKEFLDKKGYAKYSDKVIKSVKKKFGSKPSSPLSKKEADEIVLRIVAQAFKEKSKFERGKYADKPPKKSGRPQFKSSRKEDQEKYDTVEKIAKYLKNMDDDEREALAQSMGWRS